MKQYLDYLRHIQEHGRDKTDRTGTGTRSVFGYQMRFNLQEGLPIVTTKQLHLKSIIHELIWFLSGSTNTKYLKDNGVTIWDEWADENGELGPIYGHQWRFWKGDVLPETLSAWPDGSVNMNNAEYEAHDQIAEVIKTLKTNPDSRRIIVSAWNVAEIAQMKLPPCHAFFQFYVDDLTPDEMDVTINNYRIDHGIHANDEKFYQRDKGFYELPFSRNGKAVTPQEREEMIREDVVRLGLPTKRLSCQLYQRSCDSFLGVPFNIASYALLTHMFAQQCDMVVGDFIWTGGDCHIYSNHQEQVKTQLSRTPHPLPQLVFKRKPKSIFDYKYEDFEIVNYVYDPSIKAPVAK